MNLLFKINKPVEFVFDYLTDMQKFVSVHPIIFKIDEIGNDSYLVHETLKFGILPFSFTYTVAIEKSTVSRGVIMRATVFKWTKIQMNFILKSEREFTVIEEDIQFESFMPIKFILKSIFRKQHSKLFKNIEMI